MPHSTYGLGASGGRLEQDNKFGAIMSSPGRILCVESYTGLQHGDLTKGMLPVQATLMTPPNATWREVIEQAKQNVDVLKQPGIIRNLQNILQTNVSVCSSLGQPFITQMTLIYQDMLNVYR